MPDLSKNVKYALIIILIVGLFVSILPIIAFINPNNRCIKGDPSSFDPIKKYETVKHYAGGNDLHLVSIQVNYVKTDGTIDLYANYKPNVRYDFYKPITTETNKEMPLGVKGSHPGYKLIRVKISKPYRFEFWAYKPGSTKGRFHLGMFKESYDVFSQPKKAFKPNCLLKKLWNNVFELDREIPKNSVAVITYTNRGFSFSIQNTKYYYTFDPDGNLIK